MHEHGLCKALINQAEALARAHGVDTIKTITVRVGPLAGVQAGQLAEAFPLARAGTAAHQARLVIEPQALRVRCLACAAESETDPSQLGCPRCGAQDTQLIDGDAVLLADVELAL